MLVKLGDRIEVAYWQDADSIGVDDGDEVLWNDGFVNEFFEPLDFEPTHWRPNG